MKQNPNRRFHILNSFEVAELYSLPNFNQSDRKDYFALDGETRKLVNSLRRMETRAYLILLLGYFRARPVVFNFTFEEVKSDLAYIQKEHLNDSQISLDDLPKTTKTKVTKKMLDYVGYSLFQNKGCKESLSNRLHDVVKINVEPRYMFDECIAFFGQNRIALPGYTTIQDLISSALNSERKRIEVIMDEKLLDTTKTRLLELLESNDTFTDLSQLKRAAKDFSTGQIRRELNTHNSIRKIYPELKELIRALGLSPKNLEYYASLVKYKSVYKLRRHADDQAVLYLACYLYFRYRESNDNLITAFKYLVNKLTESATKYAKNKVVEDIDTVRNKLKVAGSLLNYFIDDSISDEVKFGAIRKKLFVYSLRRTFICSVRIWIIRTLIVKNMNGNTLIKTRVK